MKTLFVFISLFLSLSILSGELGSGGGPRMMKASEELNSKNQLTLNKDEISDLKLRDETIIPIEDFVERFGGDGTNSGGGKITLKPEDLFNVIDIQLIDGKIIKIKK